MAHELKLCGLAAVLARFRRDPGSISRLYFDATRSRAVGDLCSELAAARRVYRCVPDEELERVAGSVHHGGVVAVVPAPVLHVPRRRDLEDWADHRDPVLLLDRISNAHNLGAIVRTAAAFGFHRIVLPDHRDAARPTSAAYRVAEGGFEAVDVYSVPDLADCVRDMHDAGYDVVGASTRRGVPLGEASGRGDANSRRRGVALVLGNEEHGLSHPVETACTYRVTIPTLPRTVESLNVSVAAAVLMWELTSRYYFTGSGGGGSSQGAGGGGGKQERR